MMRLAFSDQPSYSALDHCFLPICSPSLSVSPSLCQLLSITPRCRSTFTFLTLTVTVDILTHRILIYFSSKIHILYIILSSWLRTSNGKRNEETKEAMKQEGRKKGRKGEREEDNTAVQPNGN